jgi:hypothetical protein
MNIFLNFTPISHVFLFLVTRDNNLLGFVYIVVRYDLMLGSIVHIFVMLLKIYSCFHGDYFELACSVGFVGGGFGFPEDGFEFVNE